MRKEPPRLGAELLRQTFWVVETCPRILSVIGELHSATGDVQAIYHSEFVQIPDLHSRPSFDPFYLSLVSSTHE